MNMYEDVWDFWQRSLLRCVHSLLQHSWSTDVSITYLPQLNATHCRKVKINFTFATAPFTVVDTDSISSTATATQLAALYYEHSFIVYVYQRTIFGAGMGRDDENYCDVLCSAIFWSRVFFTLKTGSNLYMHIMTSLKGENP